LRPGRRRRLEARRTGQGRRTTGARALSVAWRRVPASTDVTTHPDIDGLLAGLEPSQREAVLADEPVVCVLAGAGTGKTRVLTLRVARRVLDGTAHPSHGLVCTFSRKAAQELRDRLWQLGVGREVQAGTFHRAALRLITQHRQEHGQRAPAVVSDRRQLLAEVLGTGGGGRRTGTRDRGYAPQARDARMPTSVGRDVARLEAEIGWAKSRLVGPTDYEATARRAARRAAMPAARIADLYARYEHLRRLRGVLDLDDLLSHAGDLLEEDAAFSRAVRWWHRHLFVDEMQDLNDAQYRLLRLLVGEEPDLFVVGDPNQSVYGWNGADPELLRRVTEEFSGTRVVRLETNHRCAAPVVRIATAALGSRDAPPATRDDGPLPTVACFGNDEEEARWVARQAWLAHRPGRAWSSIAVLARTNAQLARIAEALAAERVPARISGSELGPASDVRGTRDTDRVASAVRAADADADSIHRSGDDSGDDSDDADSIHGSDDDSGGAPTPPPTRTGRHPPSAGDAVVLSTFHRAKGLQWRTVFVVGVSDGLVPHASARSSAAKAEERRLLYVAMTRAEEELTCTWALRPNAASAADDVAERRASPWIVAVERTLDELRSGGAEAPPDRAVEHLARMRVLLPPASTGEGGLTP